MHLEILDKKQQELLHYLQWFNRSFYLVGGTAIAFHLGHRRSLDFDLATPSTLIKSRIKSKLIKIPGEQFPLFEDFDQLHVNINGVKLTFFNFPYPVSHPIKIEPHISLPTLLSLAAMKAFALGRRAKWKDYVDLFFILKDHYSIPEISREGGIIFGNQFSEKLFRQQLAFHEDIDYSEPLDYLISPVPETEIRRFLIDKATEL